MMQEEKENGKVSLRRRYDMERVLSSRELIVLRAGRCATVYGCRKILFYSPAEITLRIGKRALSVVGEGLCCTCFSGGSVTVEGEINGIFYRSEETMKQEKGSHL